MKKTIYHIVTVCIVFVLVGCAQLGSSLTGGPKDEYAPKIDSVGTFPLNGQTNFQGTEIKIRFNEYIQLNKPTDNILITPQPKLDPIIKAKNKKLTISFLEELNENTTYTISFNNAITDITEKNDSVFQYVFSTGNYIDSLSVSGNVLDGFTNEKQEGFLVALYEKTDTIPFDSIPSKLAPTYIAQTSKSGNFELNYLKQGEYHLFAIQDENKNLKLEASEAVAFLPEKTIQVSQSESNYDLLSFKRLSKEVKLERTNFEYPGKITFVFSNPTTDFEVNTVGQLNLEDTNSEDSLVFWLSNSPVSKMEFITNLAGDIDTLKPLYKGVPEKAEDRQLQLTNNVKEGKLLPQDSLIITFSEPIGAIDSNKIRFFDVDSNRVMINAPIIQNLRSLVFPTYDTDARSIFLDSAAVKSFYGNVNGNMAVSSFENRPMDYFGSLIINIDSIPPGPIQVQLLNSEQEVVRDVPFEKPIVFEDLVPGKYQLRIILDTDRDGKWTSGSLIDLRLPESVIYNTELINVKSKWEKEVDWVLNKESWQD